MSTTLRRSLRRAIARMSFPLLAVVLSAAPLSAQQAGPPTDSLGDALPDGAIARLGTRRLRHDQDVMGVAFTPDAAGLWSIDIRGELHLSDAATGKLLRTLNVDRPPIRAISLPLDCKRIAIGREMSGASIIDAATGAVQLDLERFGSRAVFSPDGRWIAAWGPPYTKVNLLDAADGAVKHEMNEQVTDFPSVVFSRDGQRVALVGRLKTGPRSSTASVSVRDTATGEVVTRFEIPETLVFDAAFSPDGARLALGDDHGIVQIRDARTGEQGARWSGFGFPVHGLCFSPDGRYLADTAEATQRSEAGVRMDAFTLHDGTTLDVVREIRGHQANISSLAFTPDSHRLASGCRDHSARLWEVPSGTRILAPTGHETGVSGVAASADGSLVLSGGDDGQLGVWNGRTWALQSMVSCADTVVLAVACSPDGRLAAVSDLEGSVRLYLTATGEERASWTADKSRMARALVFSPDGRTLASAEQDGKIRLRDVSGAYAAKVAPDGEAGAALAKPLRELDAGGSVAFCLAFSADGTRLASGTSRLRLFAPATGEMLHDVKGTSPIGGVAFSPDGALVATANADRTVRLYGTSDAAPRGVLSGHLSRVQAVTFSGDGRLLASAGDEDTLIRLWDVAQLAPAGELAGHAGDVRALRALGSDRLASASADGVVLIWKFQPRAAPAAPGG